MAFHLSRNDRIEIDTTLAHFLEMNEEGREKIIRSIESGAFCIFGYGSLIGNPHDTFDEEFAAFITGHRLDAVFSDRHYRGTPDKLGITLGLEPTQNPEDRVHGLVRVVRFLGDESDYVGRVRKSLRKFVMRETSLNPIYEYQAHTATVLESESQTIKEQFGEVSAIVCGTNVGNPQYIGPTIDNYDPEHPKYLTKWEKAAIIATSIGSDDADTRHRTGMDYWRFILAGLCQYEKKYGVPPPPRVVELVQFANAVRRVVSRALRRSEARHAIAHQLASREAPNMAERRHYPEIVFKADPEAIARLSTKNFYRRRLKARNKMGRGDPLPVERLYILKRRMLDLAGSPHSGG